jgi:hypothetical protein
MGRDLNPGPASLLGLEWVAGVGPVSIEAWTVAMGWGRTAGFSHTARLVKAGWAGSCAMTRGSGSLIYATTAGVRAAGVSAKALRAAPAPTTWAHWDACGWTAAWLTARGRRMIGSRQLLLNDHWRAEVEWMEHGDRRRRSHRPDLLAGITSDGPMIPIEVELASKSPARLRAILALYGRWVATGKTAAVIYVCSSVELLERVQREGREVGLSAERKTLRAELVSTIREAARAARRTDAGARPDRRAPESEAA